MKVSEFQSLENCATQLASESGAILLAHFGTNLKIEQKTQDFSNPVTNADEASNNHICREITRLFPEHSILSEENITTVTPKSEVIWVIDPLDGTLNFINGLPLFGVSIAVVVNGRTVAAAIYLPAPTAPADGLVLHSSLGRGVYLNGKPLPPREDTVQIGPAPLYTLPMNSSLDKKITRFPNPSTGHIRNTGSIAYEMAHIALGTFAFGLFLNPRVWDIAAGVLLAQESGCLVQTRPPTIPGWYPFENFLGKHSPSDQTREQLLKWDHSLIAGRSKAVSEFCDNYYQRPLGIKRAFQKARDALKR